MFSGVGCRILINGEIYRGATGAAGELGINSGKSSKDYANQILSLDTYREKLEDYLEDLMEKTGGRVLRGWGVEASTIQQPGVVPGSGRTASRGRWRPRARYTTHRPRGGSWWPDQA